MYTLPTAPRPIGGVLDDAIGLYRATFKQCWLLALISGVFSAAVSMYQTAGLRSVSTATTAQGWAALIQSMQISQRSSHSNLVGLVSVIVWLVIRAAIVARQHAAATGQEDSFGSALAVGLRRLPSAIGGGLTLVVLIAIGFVLLVIPGIWLWGMFQVWFVALVVEQLGPFKALGRSWRLVEGHWWRTSALVSVALIIILILSAAVGMTGAWFGLAVSHGGAGIVLLAWQLVAAAISVITTPLLMAVMLSMYYDLKLRREGGDLAVRLSSLQPV
jgi:hypothetical protein